jgi:hypothetical protein
MMGLLLAIRFLARWLTPFGERSNCSGLIGKLWMRFACVIGEPFHICFPLPIRQVQDQESNVPARPTPLQSIFMRIPSVECMQTADVPSLNDGTKLLLGRFRLERNAEPHRHLYNCLGRPVDFLCYLVQRFRGLCQFNQPPLFFERQTCFSNHNGMRSALRTKPPSGVYSLDDFAVWVRTEIRPVHHRYLFCVHSQQMPHVKLTA